jgi:hypothetical protein
MTNSTAKSEPRLEDVNGILLPNHDPIKKFANRRRNQSNSLVMAHVPVRGTVTFGRHVPASEAGGLPSLVPSGQKAAGELSSLKHKQVEIAEKR